MICVLGPEDKMCDCPRLGYAYKKANYTVKWSGLEPIRSDILFNYVFII